MYESYINKIEDVGKLRNLKPKTITLYQKNVSRFLNYIQKNPEELTCEDARNYLLHLQGKGDKASTLNNNNTVTYYVKDYREEGKWKEYTISGIEFIRRFLMHVPPKRFVRIRHYGLLCTRSKTKHITLCRNLLGCKQYLSKLKDMEAPQILETLYGINVTVCKCCGGHLGKPQQRIPLRI